jgi:type II secretory pathway pseudopilin PulG
MVAPTRQNPYTGPRQGARPGARTVSAAQIYRRPGVITVLAVLHFIFGPLSLLIGGGMLIGALLSEGGAGERGLVIGVSAFYAVFGLLSIVCGIGLWNLKSYGRTIQLVYSFIGLLGIPVGTLISALILVYLYKPGVKVLFSETPPAQLSAADIAEVNKLSESSGLVVAVIAVVALLAVVAFVGIIAAIAIPSLLRARVSANEAQAIGDIRTVISAEAAYASSNGGQYDQLECLAKPQECIPGYPPDGPSFLQEVYPAVRSGYQREFQGGLPADASDVAFANLSPSSVQSFVYLAYPSVPGTTGVRGFCGDYTGRICVTPDGSRPLVVSGQCDPACTLLQ